MEKNFYRYKIEIRFNDPHLTAHIYAITNLEKTKGADGDQLT